MIVKCFRIWWLIAVALSTGFCIFAIFNIWYIYQVDIKVESKVVFNIKLVSNFLRFKWEGRPVIVSFDDKSTPISTIPFPAITICPTNKFIKEKIDTELFVNILTEMTSNKSALKSVSPEMYEEKLSLYFL